MLWARAVESCIGGAGDDAAWDPGEVPAVVVEATPAKESFRIGEPAWIDVHVANAVPVAVECRGPNCKQPSVDLRMLITGPEGRRCPPSAVEIGFRATGAMATDRIDLAQHAWLDAPGTYSLHFYGPSFRVAAPPPDRLGFHARVHVVPPDDPEAFVHTSLDDRRPDQRTLEALGHPVFVPILERIATDGGFVSPTGAWISARDSAEKAITACPCIEATEAMIRLHDRDPDASGVVAKALLARMRGSGSSKDCFAGSVFSPDMGAALAGLARRALEVPTTDPDWVAAYEWGGEILARIGVAEDGRLVLRALDRAQAMPNDTVEERYEAVRKLGWAALVHPAEGTPLSADAALLATVLERAANSTGTAPPERERVLLQALASDDLDVLVHALDRLPSVLSRALVAALLPHVGSSSAPVRRHLGDTLSRFSPSRPRLPVDEWLDLILNQLRDDPANTDLAGLLSSGLIECTTVRRAPVTAEEIPGLVAAWTSALRQHRRSLHDGPLPVVPGVTNPALVPASYRCEARPGEIWPVR